VAGAGEAITPHLVQRDEEDVHRPEPTGDPITLGAVAEKQTGTANQRLILVALALVFLSAVLFAIGFVAANLALIYLSLACSVAGAFTLVYYLDARRRS
jgi:hypothetical protein